MSSQVSTAQSSLEQEVIEALKTIYDPEIPVDIYSLGLIYEVAFDEKPDVYIKMTLTTPFCPVAESLPMEVQERVSTVEGIVDAHVEVTWDPPWTKDMMSEEAKLELGFL